MKYFAYGSNLNIRHMQWRCQNAVPLGAYTLQGYQLIFRYYADLIPAQDNSVKGGLWEISEEDERLLDRYEGYPSLYEKYYDGDIMFYRMLDDARDIELPGLGYLEGMLEGMENFGLSPLEDLNNNLGEPPTQGLIKEGDLLQHAMRLISDAMGIKLLDEDSITV
ncbi:MAG: gamma-glutamylcyclotransferase [Candidatus Poribacteria bacterium]|nr:gamma-glutamylcyclotransferase [Candidatus Poribacteria bacterium]